MTRYATSLILLAATTPALAQTVPSTSPSTTPSTTRADVTAGTVAIVDAVVGKVQVKVPGMENWVDALVGMELREGAQIRTGFRSSVRCAIPPDQTFTLDRLGTIEVTQAIRQGNLIKTDLTMKYGRAQYRIEKAGFDHAATLSSPSATLAVRGTTVELEDSPPFAPRAISYTGRAAFNANNRQSIVGSKGGTTASMDAGAISAANTALLAGVIDPQYAGSKSPSDLRLVATQVSLGATARFDRAANIAVIEGGPGPVKLESDLLSMLPGTLSFVARWTGNADINLEVGVNKGDPTAILNKSAFHFSEFLYPGYGLNASPSGGHTDFDDRGGPNGGQEIVYWSGSYPKGVYGLAVVHQAGGPAEVTVNAFLNGQKLLLIDFAPQAPVSPDGGGASTTFTYQMTKGNIVAPLVFLPLLEGNPLFGLPDANNGAPADLKGPVAQNTDHLASAKVKNTTVKSLREKKTTLFGSNRNMSKR